MDQTTTAPRPFLLRLAGVIVKARVLILLLTVAAMVFCCFSTFWVQTDTELSSFLADDDEARRGLNIMEQEFTTYATAQVMVRDVNASQAGDLKTMLEGVDGVALVRMKTTTDELGDAALYDLTFSAQEHEEQLAGLERVRASLSDYDIVVDSGIDFDYSVVVLKEMASIMLIASAVVLIVLLITSTTWAEIPVLLLTFFAAAVVQQGTNFLLGTISMISNSVTLILQLALSLDYAIIFCNRYKEEHRIYPIRESVERALAKALPEVFASSLTTIAGLTAMTFMKFRLGADLGIVLIKAIALSLLSVFLVMPGLLMLFGKLMDRTKHRSFVPKIPFVGRFAWATRKVIPILFVFLFAGAFYLYQNVNLAYSEDLLVTPKQNSHQIAQRAIAARFGESNPLAVLVPSGDLEKEKALLADLEACDEVSGTMGLASIDAMGGYKLGDEVNSAEFAALANLDDTMAQGLFAYYGAMHGATEQVTNDPENYRVPIIDLFLFLHDKAESGEFEVAPEQMELIRGLYSQLSMARDQLQGKNYSRLVLTLALPSDGRETFDFLDRVHVIAEQYYPADQVVTVGNATNSYDFQKSFEQDNLVVTLLSLLLVMIILLFTFRSLGMPILLILVIQGSICLNFAIARLTGSYVFFTCFLIVTAIQMGANIDYAIVISSRYSELRGKHLPARDSMIEALNFVFPTIITSGTIMVVAGLLIGQLVSEAVIAGIGHFVGTGTIITLLLVMFVLPQLLLFGEGFARATQFGTRKIPEKKLRRAACLALAAASIFALVAGPVGMRTVARLQEQQANQTASINRELDELMALAESVDVKQRQLDETAYSFAEHAVTDNVGAEKLAEGEAQYNAGEAQYRAGEAQYNAGAARLAEGKEQYEAGSKTLAEAKEQYYEGVAQLEAGKLALAEGQAQMEAAKQDYAAGEARLAAVKPTYDTVKPLYDVYMQTKAQYDEAVANGETGRAVALWAAVEAQRVAYEAKLGESGYSISQLISEYEAGQAQLASGAQQIAEGEVKLAQAEQEIADGQAKLDAANAQIQAGQQELDKGKAELDKGQQELDQGKAELDAAKGRLNAGKAELDKGKAQLEENKEALTADLAELESYENDLERLDASVRRLSEIPGVSALTPKGATYGEVLTAARDYFALDDEAAQAEFHARTLRYGALVIAGVLGLNAGIFSMFWRRGGRTAAIAAVPFALAAALFGGAAYGRVLADGSGSGLWQFAAALAVLLFALGTVLVLQLGILREKEAAPEGAEAAGTAETAGEVRQEPPKEVPIGDAWVQNKLDGFEDLPEWPEPPSDPAE